jgi:lysozyme
MRALKSHILLILIISLIVFGCKGSENRSAESFEVWGIDLSKHQRSVNWDKLIDSNQPAFVYLKATEGTLISDPTYAKRKTELNNRDILCGAYHFFGHRTDGKEQAENFIKTANLKKGDLIPVLDIEHHRFFKDRQWMIKQTKAFCKKIRSHYGVYPIIYCSSNFYERYLKDDFPDREYILWIADYRGEPTHKWTIWQHTDNHRIKGISSAVDRNVFDGSQDDLKKLILR